VTHVEKKWQAHRPFTINIEHDGVCMCLGRDGPGAASPGRALQGVRDKLDAYYAKQQQQQQQQRMHAGE
jgi:hypothetical protein